MDKILESNKFNFNDEQSNSSKLKNKCTICLENFTKVSELICLPFCKHIFHLNCLKIWSYNGIVNPKCPNCNDQILLDHNIIRENIVIEVVNNQYVINSDNVIGINEAIPVRLNVDDGNIEINISDNIIQSSCSENEIRENHLVPNNSNFNNRVEEGEQPQINNSSIDPAENILDNNVNNKPNSIDMDENKTIDNIKGEDQKQNIIVENVRL